MIAVKRLQRSFHARIFNLLDQQHPTATTIARCNTRCLLSTEKKILGVSMMYVICVVKVKLRPTVSLGAPRSLYMYVEAC